MSTQPHQPGTRFGSLEIRDLLPQRTKYGGRIYAAYCHACGRRTEVPQNVLTNGKDSCGCLGRERRRQKATKHGLGIKHPLYKTWCNMRNRCLRPAHRDYPRYGGRGITIDPRWDDFAQFVADVGEKPGPKYTLDRQDNDGPYSPKNCRWATPQEQQSNKGPSLHSFVKWLESRYGVYLEENLLEKFLVETKSGQG